MQEGREGEGLFQGAASQPACSSDPACFERLGFPSIFHCAKPGRGGVPKGACQRSGSGSLASGVAFKVSEQGLWGVRDVSEGTPATSSFGTGRSHCWMSGVHSEIWSSFMAISEILPIELFC